ncbi:hypothetical protein CSC18_3840 [Klebsiella aerogenes]|nr:hypothetical protein CSC18_3840 [Klebsiella aerogenes]
MTLLSDGNYIERKPDCVKGYKRKEVNIALPHSPHRLLKVIQ